MISAGKRRETEPAFNFSTIDFLRDVFTYGRFQRTEIIGQAQLNVQVAIVDGAQFKVQRALRRLLRSGALKKSGLEDSEHDDERPSPNAHRQTTSHPTGATEVDPDDDPRYWGAHPIGLLLPRRGHQ